MGVQTREFQLIPVGTERSAELEALVPFLTERFPGLTFSLGEPRPLGKDVFSEHGSVSAELLMEGYKDAGPGKILLLDADLSTQVFGVVYTQVDLPRGNAVIALPRMRTLLGQIPEEGKPLAEEDQTRAKRRIEHQAANVVGKLLGIFPCKEDRCVFRRPTVITELDEIEGLCSKHAVLLNQKLEALPHGSGNGK